jgi:hypothetical protein
MYQTFRDFFHNLTVAWLQAAGALAFERWHFPPLGSHALMGVFYLFW